jgi:hypothetical protein
VFDDLSRRGLYLTSGAKFGGDWLAYVEDPDLVHAAFIVVIIEGDGDRGDGARGTDRGPRDGGLGDEGSVAAGSRILYSRIGGTSHKVLVLARVGEDGRVAYDVRGQEKQAARSGRVETRSRVRGAGGKKKGKRRGKRKEQGHAYRFA